VNETLDQVVGIRVPAPPEGGQLRWWKLQECCSLRLVEPAGSRPQGARSERGGKSEHRRGCDGEARDEQGGQVVHATTKPAACKVVGSVL
jgi:hypothetical protein